VSAARLSMPIPAIAQYYSKTGPSGNDFSSRPMAGTRRGGTGTFEHALGRKLVDLAVLCTFHYREGGRGGAKKVNKLRYSTLNAQAAIIGIIPHLLHQTAFKHSHIFRAPTRKGIWPNAQRIRTHHPGTKEPPSASQVGVSQRETELSAKIPCPGRCGGTRVRG